MAEKEWWYMCSTAIVTDCFDLTKLIMVGMIPGGEANGKAVQSRGTGLGRVINFKSYDTPVTWG
jgi:hypothetical protein